MSEKLEVIIKKTPGQCLYVDIKEGFRVYGPQIDEFYESKPIMNSLAFFYKKPSEEHGFFLVERRDENPMHLGLLGAARTDSEADEILHTKAVEYAERIAQKYKVPLIDKTLEHDAMKQPSSEDTTGGRKHERNNKRGS